VSRRSRISTIVLLLFFSMQIAPAQELSPRTSAGDVLTIFLCQVHDKLRADGDWHDNVERAIRRFEANTFGEGISNPNHQIKYIPSTECPDLSRAAFLGDVGAVYCDLGTWTRLFNATAWVAAAWYLPIAWSMEGIPSAAEAGRFNIDAVEAITIVDAELSGDVGTTELMRLSKADGGRVGWGEFDAFRNEVDLIRKFESEDAPCL